MASVRIETFEDILRVLREHPEWLDEIRRLILTEELLRLPLRFDALQARIEALEARFTAFQQEMHAFREEMYAFREEITAEVRALRTDVNRLDAQMQSVLNDLARLKGSDREHFYRFRAPSLFGRFMRNVQLTDMNQLYDRLYTLYPIGSREIEEIAAVDLIVEGVGRQSGVSKVVVLEASWKVDRNDVERALRRADILRAAGYNAVPAVGGAEIMDDALQLAIEQEVLVMVDGMLRNAEVAS
ncbi:MAG: hypothetical protein NZL85_02815 [Fimbriimonadales bacterium]|nr:hypothetical protein [Fimbriimonadales bacterium]